LIAHGASGLITIGPGQAEFATFQTHGLDPIELKNAADQESVIVQRCHACHSDSGIHSVQSRVQWLKRRRDTNGHDAIEDPIAWESYVTVTRKEQQPDFKLLQSLW